MGSAKKQSPETSIASRLARARVGARTLGEATDRLNAGLVAVETELQEMQLGVSATLVLIVGHGEVDLSFKRVDSKWGLFVQMKGLSGTTNTPILSAPREVRVAVANALPELVEVLLETIEEQIADVDSGVDALDVLRAELCSGKGELDMGPARPRGGKS